MNIEYLSMRLPTHLGAAQGINVNLISKYLAPLNFYASTRQHVDRSMRPCVNTRRVDASTCRRVDVSTRRRVHASTRRRVNASTVHASTSRRVDVSTLRRVDASTRRRVRWDLKYSGSEVFGSEVNGTSE